SSLRRYTSSRMRVCVCFCFCPPPPPEIYTLSLHDALPIYLRTRERFQTPAYGTGHAAFMRFLNDRIGHGWYVAKRRRHVRMGSRSEEHTSELQSREKLVCRLLLEKKKRTSRQT